MASAMGKSRTYRIISSPSSVKVAWAVKPDRSATWRHVCLQVGYPDRCGVSAQRSQRACGVAVAAVLGRGPIRHLPAAVGLDAQFAASDQAPAVSARAANVRVGPPQSQLAAHRAKAAATVALVKRYGHQPNRRAVSSSSARWAAMSCSRWPFRVTVPSLNIGASPGACTRVSVSPPYRHYWRSQMRELPVSLCI